MALPNLSVPLPAPRWLVCPRFDIFFLIASPLFAVCFYGVYLLFTADSLNSKEVTSSAFFFFFIFTGIFDAPHIVQTFARTHFDRTEYSRRKIWHWILPGLAMCISVFCYRNDWGEEFLGLLGIYGTWHIIRQNVGFVRLYQRLNRSLESSIAPLEIHLHHLALLVFYLFQTTALDDLLGRNIIFEYALTLTVVRVVVLSVFMVVLAIVIFKNTEVLLKKGTWNTPKMLLILTNMSLLLWLILLEVHPLILTAIATIGHNVQYQAWMWVYQKRRTQSLRVPLIALTICMVFGIAMMVSPDQIAIYYNGLVLWHYFIDGTIWRFGSSPELRDLLDPEPTVLIAQSG